MNANRRCHGVCIMATAEARLSRRLPAVVEVGKKTLPALFAHQSLIDFARGLFATTHRIGHIGSAGDYVSACVEVGTAGLERKTINGNRSVLFKFEARCEAKVLIECFTNREDHTVTLEALHFICGDGPLAT